MIIDFIITIIIISNIKFKFTLVKKEILFCKFSLKKNIPTFKIDVGCLQGKAKHISVCAGFWSDY